MTFTEPIWQVEYLFVDVHNPSVIKLSFVLFNIFAFRYMNFNKDLKK